MSDALGHDGLGRQHTEKRQQCDGYEGCCGNRNRLEHPPTRGKDRDRQGDRRIAGHAGPMSGKACGNGQEWRPPSGMYPDRIHPSIKETEGRFLYQAGTIISVDGAPVTGRGGQCDRSNESMACSSGSSRLLVFCGFLL